MRILHLLASPVWSGPAENVALLALAQRALGHEVHVAIDRKRGQGTSEEPAKPRLEALGLLDDDGLELSVKSTPMAMLADAWALRKRRVQVLHSHFSHDHLLARWARPSGTRLIRSIHAPRSLRWSLPSADGYTASTDDELRQLSRGPSIVLHPLVDAAYRPSEDQPALRQRLGITGEPVIGMTSTFQASRGHRLALEAFAQIRQTHPAARLLLVGDGILEQELRAKARAHGIGDSVTFAGYQKGPAYVQWLQAMDELWVLGLGNDYSGRVVAQARACGVRTIAVREGALPELADASLPTPEVASLVGASLAKVRRAIRLRSPEEIATGVLALYKRVGAQ